mmetsp:Transcript_17281/g.33689  ORF Transcript_17281/g.33689 Transcript_17281/m.33689 type:complete len:215 (-) Transcript_17281:95-739(-)
MKWWLLPMSGAQATSSTSPPCPVSSHTCTHFCDLLPKAHTKTVLPQPTASIGPSKGEGFHAKHVHGTLTFFVLAEGSAVKAASRVQMPKLRMSLDSYTRSWPSCEAAASFNPWCRGANPTACTVPALSERVPGHFHTGMFLSGSIVSSWMRTCLSTEQEARTLPNSGWAQDNRKIDPLCLALISLRGGHSHLPSSFLSHILMLWSEEQVARRLP